MAVDKDEKMPAQREIQGENGIAEDDEDMTLKYQENMRIYAQWAGNNLYYPATIETVDYLKKKITVLWDDKQETHRQVTFDMVREEVEEDSPGPWTMARIERKAVVKDSETKGRCLFSKQAVQPGGIVFVEGPCLVALPGDNEKLWDGLKKLHEKKPLNLGTITFHYAAILTELTRDREKIQIVSDKFVPDPDEEAQDDVIRILEFLKENLAVELKLKEYPLNPKHIQRLVSAWRYNSFGHHKEDGLVLYNRISMCAHSCDPSCCWSYGQEDSFVLRARVNLKDGDELTISYLQDEDLLKGTDVRRNKLQNWRFQCGCDRCNLKVDTGRGFRCRICSVGVCYFEESGSFTPCSFCGSLTTKTDVDCLVLLETQYVQRVETLDKTDVADVESVMKAAVEVFEKHWMLYSMHTMLWEAYRNQERLSEALQHQLQRIDFHTHYYPRPTFILAWCHEELGDATVKLYPKRLWCAAQDFTRAFHMLSILCGREHQYSASSHMKWHQAIADQQQMVQDNAESGGYNTASKETC